MSDQHDNPMDLQTMWAGGHAQPRIETYIHERPEWATCQFGWAETDTIAPHTVRHECELIREADPDHDQHVCTCGLIEVHDDRVGDDLPPIELPERDHRHRPDDALLDIVLDTYTPDGVAIWLRNWINADNTRRIRMRVSLMSAESGNV